MGSHEGCPCGGECHDGALSGVRPWAPTRGAPTVGRQGGKEYRLGLVFTFFNRLESLKRPAISDSGSFPRVHRRFGVGYSVAGNQCQRWLKSFTVSWARRSAGARPGRTVASVSRGGCEGRHMAGTYGDLIGLAGRGLAGHFRLGTCNEYRHPVDDRCCRRGGVAGAEPPHKGGPNRPDRPELQ